MTPRLEGAQAHLQQAYHAFLQRPEPRLATAMRHLAATVEYERRSRRKTISKELLNVKLDTIPTKLTTDYEALGKRLKIGMMLLPANDESILAYKTMKSHMPRRWPGYRLKYRTVEVYDTLGRFSGKAIKLTMESL